MSPMFRVAFGLALLAACAHRAPSRSVAPSPRLPVPPSPAPPSPVTLARPPSLPSSLIFRDTFDARDAHPEFSLNHSLADRQSGALAPATWSRAPGVWYPGHGPEVRHSSVVGPWNGGDGRLVLRANTGVRLERALTPDARRGYELRFRFDPVAGNVASLGWLSVMLSTDPDSLGWAGRPDTISGLLVRSNGAVQLFHRGGERAVVWEDGALVAAPSYDVTLRVWRDDDAPRPLLRLRGRINSHGFTSTLEEGAEVTIPSPVWLMFGAHFHPDHPEPESWIDAVQVGSSDEP